MRHSLRASDAPRASEARMCGYTSWVRFCKGIATLTRGPSGSFGGRRERQSGLEKVAERCTPLERGSEVSTAQQCLGGKRWRIAGSDVVFLSMHQSRTDFGCDL